MSSMEILGGIKAVVNRTRQNAEEAAAAAEIKIRGLLAEGIDEDDALALERLDRIINKVGIKATEKYFRKRNEGLANDTASKEPGLMALVKSAGAKSRFEGWSAEHPGDPHNPILVEVGQVGEDPIFVLSMPLGAFRVGLGHVRFYPEPQVSEDGQVIFSSQGEFEGDVGISLDSLNHVIRIEGAAGELWQRPYYSPDEISKQ
ncbi:MAG TPA: hypothetical protein VMR08_00455 [Patescibacteria group bacterium]|nr:hypothetical protein [Patescibacteria group bacterium]